MAEVIGVAAAILQLISTCNTISKRISEIRDAPNVLLKYQKRLYDIRHLMEHINVNSCRGQVQDLIHGLLQLVESSPVDKLAQQSSARRFVTLLRKKQEVEDHFSSVDEKSKHLLLAINADHASSLSSIDGKLSELMMRAVESQKAVGAPGDTRSDEGTGASIQSHHGAIAGPGADQVNGIDAEGSIPCQNLPRFVFSNCHKIGPGLQINGLRVSNFDGTQDLPQINASFESCTAMSEGGDGPTVQVNGLIFQKSRK